MTRKSRGVSTAALHSFSLGSPQYTLNTTPICTDPAMATCDNNLSLSFCFVYVVRGAADGAGSSTHSFYLSHWLGRYYYIYSFIHSFQMNAACMHGQCLCKLGGSANEEGGVAELPSSLWPREEHGSDLHQASTGNSAGSVGPWRRPTE